MAHYANVPAIPCTPTEPHTIKAQKITFNVEPNIFGTAEIKVYHDHAKIIKVLRCQVGNLTFICTRIVRTAYGWSAYNVEFQ